MKYLLETYDGERFFLDEERGEKLRQALRDSSVRFIELEKEGLMLAISSIKKLKRVKSLEERIIERG